MKILIAGGSGLIGTRLQEVLRKRGDEVRLLPRFGTAPWDVEGADAVVNLAGASIAGKRWTPQYKQEIRESRTRSTRALVDAIDAARKKPRVLVNGSAVGYYGDSGDEPVEETARPGSDFLAEVVSAWEAEARRATIRSVQIRTGHVLAAHGGALAKMIPPFKAFAGGPLGSGRQWFPWIHLDDEVSAIVFAIDGDVVGPLNLAAPGIVTMKEFARALGHVLHRPSWAPVPAPVLRVVVGELAEALLTGQRVIPVKLEAAGFRFRFPALDGALGDLLPG
jgi:uncharacterized protein (TIGR01777 family)